MPEYLTWPYAIPGSTVMRTTPDRFAEIKSVKDFGAAGDGVEDDTDALQAMFDVARDDGGSWYLPPGDYLVSDTVTAYTSGRCDGRIVAVNADNSWFPFQVKHEDADLITIPLATVNGWTWIVKGATASADLAAYYGSTITFYSNDEKMIIRRGSSGANYQDVIVVDAPDGTFTPPIITTKSVPWVSAAVNAVRNRQPITIEGVTVAFLTGSGQSIGGIWVQRSNTILRSPSVLNYSTGKIQQGIAIGYSSYVTVYDGYVEGISEDVTNYAFGVGGSAFVSFVNCREVFCRRGIDGTAAKQVRVIGGDFPNGVGAHWVDGFEISGAHLANDLPNNAVGWFTGKDVNIHHCRIVMRPDQTMCIGMRTDMPELDGSVRLDDNEILIDCTTALDVVRKLVEISSGTSGAHNYGKQLLWPEFISICRNRIHQVGAAFNTRLECLGMAGSSTNPSGIRSGGTVIIRDNDIKLDAGVLLGAGGARLWGVSMGKSLAHTAGRGYRIVIDGLPSCHIYLWCDPAHPNPSGLRHTVTAYNVGPMGWQGGFGAFITCDLYCTSMLNNFGTGRPVGGYVTPIGDEIETRKGPEVQLFSSLVATADAPITGYMNVRDATGTFRKVAVIA